MISASGKLDFGFDDPVEGGAFGLSPASLLDWYSELFPDTAHFNERIGT
jgi:hypothetical protein